MSLQKDCAVFCIFVTGMSLSVDWPYMFVKKYRILQYLTTPHQAVVQNTP